MARLESAIWSVVAFLIAGAGIAYFVDFAQTQKQASDVGFDSVAQMQRAAESGIGDGEAWRQKLVAENQRSEVELRAKIEAGRAEERRALFNKISFSPYIGTGTFYTIQDLNEATIALSVYEDAIRRAREASPTLAETKIIAAADKKLKDSKRASYPKLRRAFGQIAQKILWIDDFKVNQAPTGLSDHITFIHHSFVLRRNIQEAHNKISSYLSDVRFRKACYSGSESTYSELICYEPFHNGDDW